MEKIRSFAFTLAVQVFLCFLFYLSLNLGKPHSSIFHPPTDDAFHMYFLSVNGASTPLLHHSHLLKQMEIVARLYKVKFIINISELGQDDSLALNASRLFSSMNVSWYPTAASKDQEGACFLEQINTYNRKMLTIVRVNTELLQDIMPERSASDFENNLTSNWLSQTLEAAAGSWLIVVGQHPVVVCEENGEQIKSKHVYEPLHRIFMAYGVNAYLSSHGCSNNTLEDGVAYIGSPYPVKRQPYLASLNKNSAFQKKTDIGFLLHRLSSAEFTTYFITLSGEVLKKIVIRQKGKEVM